MINTECKNPIRNHRDLTWDFKCLICGRWVKNISPYGGANYVDRRGKAGLDYEWYEYICENCFTYNPDGSIKFEKNINKHG